MTWKLVPVYDRSEISHFANDEECAAFWDAAELTEEYLRKYAYPPDRPRVRRLRATVPAREPQEAG